MGSLNWQDASKKNAPAKARPDTEHSPQVTPTASNPWFAVSLGLMGLIIGFGLGTMNNGSRTLAGNVLNPPPTNIPSVPTQQQQPEAPTTDPSKIVPIDATKDHIRGNPNADVVIFEYSDLECPFCKRVHPTFQEIMTNYGDKVMWVYRHFPLSFHQSAQKLAEASECVAELGGNEAFWKFADGYYEKSGGAEQPMDIALSVAKSLGISEASYKSCLDSGKYAQKVKDDEQGGIAAGVSGTPGNIVLNLKTKKVQLVEGARPFEAFKTAIDEVLK